MYCWKNNYALYRHGDEQDKGCMLYGAILYGKTWTFRGALKSHFVTRQRENRAWKNWWDFCMPFYPDQASTDIRLTLLTWRNIKLQSVHQHQNFRGKVKGEGEDLLLRGWTIAIWWPKKSVFTICTAYCPLYHSWHTEENIWAIRTQSDTGHWNWKVLPGFRLGDDERPERIQTTVERSR